MPASDPWRRRGAWAALVLGCLALFVANIALFLRLFVFDSDTFTDAVAPTDPDEKVVDAVADTLSTRILDNAEVQQRIQELTPDDNPLVAATVADAAGGFLENLVRTVLDSDTFRSLWRGAVETAHDRFVAMVDDDDREPVVLDLTQFVGQVDQRLEARGIDLFTGDTIQYVGEVVAVRRTQIEEVRTGLDLLRKGSVVATIVAVVLLIVALVLAVDRRKMAMRLGLGIVVAMVVTGIAMRIARRVVLDRFEVETRRDAVASLWGRVFTELSRQTVGLFVLGVVVAGGAWLIGRKSSSPQKGDAMHRTGLDAGAAGASA